MRIELTNEDYANVTGQIIGEDATLDVLDDDVSQVMDQLPRMVAGRLKAMVPQDFRILQIEIAFEVSGKIAGSGISGTGKVVFGPRN